MESIIEQSKVFLKSKSNGAESVIEELAASSLTIAEELIELLSILERLKLDLESHPHYTSQNYHSMLMGISGAICVAGGLILLVTPALATSSPIIDTYGASIAAAGGAVSVGGGIACYKGFAKTAVDRAAKKAVVEYIRQKHEEFSLLKAPCYNHNTQAQALNMMIQTEFPLPRGVSMESLAEYVDSFYVLESAFLRKGPPYVSVLETVRRFLSSKRPILEAVTAAAAKTSAYRCRSGYRCLHIRAFRGDNCFPIFALLY